MNGFRRKNITIKTPEGIVFPLRLASPVSRFLALAIDRACVYAALFGVNRLIALLAALSADLARAVFMIAAFLLSFGYPIVMEWYCRGQTFGKKLLRLQVMDEQGLRLHFSQVVVRNLLRVVDALPWFYMVGGISAFVSARGQRLGDIAANTIVVQHRRIREPDLDQVLPDKYNSFRDYPHLTARLRQHTSPQEAGLCLDALMRRDELEPAARVELFAALRTYLAEQVAFPEEVTDGISDEQYVRNAVEVLFR